MLLLALISGQTQRGGIAPGYNAELDEWRALADGASDYLEKLEVREREKWGIDTLKVGFNGVHGYYGRRNHHQQ